jgi:hypothetical protein
MPQAADGAERARMPSGVPMEAASAATTSRERRDTGVSAGTGARLRRGPGGGAQARHGGSGSGRARWWTRVETWERFGVALLGVLG